MQNQTNIFKTAAQYGKSYKDAVAEYQLLTKAGYTIHLVKIVGTALFTTCFHSKRIIEEKLFKTYQLA